MVHHPGRFSSNTCGTHPIQIFWVLSYTRVMDIQLDVVIRKSVSLLLLAKQIRYHRAPSSINCEHVREIKAFLLLALLQSVGISLIERPMHLVKSSKGSAPFSAWFTPTSRMPLSASILRHLAPDSARKSNSQVTQGYASVHNGAGRKPKRIPCNTGFLQIDNTGAYFCQVADRVLFGTLAQLSQ